MANHADLWESQTILEVALIKSKEYNSKKIFKAEAGKMELEMEL